MPDYADPRAQIDAFRANLGGQPDDERIVREHILHGTAYAIEDGVLYGLKQRVSAEYQLDPNRDVFVVGSAKLGFSVAPAKRYKPFGDHSDVDVAIVSHELYQTVWHEVHEYALSGADWPKRERFESYLAWGWIRPDLLPRSASFNFSNSWFEFFRALQSERVAGPYRIAAALYHDISFLVEYQKGAVSKCREDRV